jgi:hypothetical protein
MSHRIAARIRGRALAAAVGLPVPAGHSAIPQQVTSTLAPAITLAQPAIGGTITQDKPVIVFRFAAADPGDPIDAKSFTAVVDGVDRSALFQVAPTEAWGPLMSAADGTQPRADLGGHQVAARICTLRGACSDISAVVTVVPPLAAGAAKSPNDKKRSLLALLLAAARKLLAP